MEKNYKCKTCGEMYHHCTSCGYEFVYDEDVYCSEKCARMDSQESKIVKTIELILAKLDDEGREAFAEILCGNTVTFDPHGPMSEYPIIRGSGKFDEDLIKEVIANRFLGRDGILAWGTW